MPHDMLLRGRRFAIRAAACAIAACSQIACVSPGSEGVGRRGLFGLSDPMPQREDTARSGGGSTRSPARGGGFAMGQPAGGARTGLTGSQRGTLARAGDGDPRNPPFVGSPYSADAGQGYTGAPRYGELVKVEGNTWRTAMPATRVFSLVGRALSQNYLVSRVDRRNLALHTDWDKFFIDGRLFRNRLVISVFPVSARQTEVVIRNSLEYFSGAPGRPEDMSESAWLPSPDITDEVTRLVEAVNVQIQNAMASRRPVR